MQSLDRGLGLRRVPGVPLKAEFNSYWWREFVQKCHKTKWMQLEEIIRENTRNAV